MQPNPFQKWIEGFQVIDQYDQGERIQRSWFTCLFLYQNRGIGRLGFIRIGWVFIKYSLTGPDPQEKEQAERPNKDHQQQKNVLRSVQEQRGGGNRAITGVMIESNLEAGNQSMSDLSQLRYGVSVTDACIDWQETQTLLRDLNAALGVKAA